MEKPREYGQSKLSLMCFRVPADWDESRLKAELEPFGRLVSVQIFSLDRGGRIGKVVFENQDSVDFILGACSQKQHQKYGLQYEYACSGVRLVFAREQQDERQQKIELTQLKAARGMVTKRIQVECVDGNEKTLPLEVAHKFTIQVKNKSIHEIQLPRLTLVPYVREFRVQPPSRRPPHSKIDPEGGVLRMHVEFDPVHRARYGTFRVALLVSALGRIL